MEQTKSIFVMFLQNVPRSEAFLRGYILHVIAGSQYLGGSVWIEAEKARWLGEKMEGW